MRVVPFLAEGLGDTSYLVTVGDGTAVAVDPCRDPAPHLQEADRLGAGIRLSFDTHLHADFVSGSRELAAARQATVVAPAGADLEFAHRKMSDGDEVDLGDPTVRAVATPGHTPEHVAYLLLDGSQPLALFSGGSLLVGAVARPDLIAPDQTEPRLGWLVPEGRPLMFVLDEDQDRKDLVRQALKIGYENLVGELDGGMDTWRRACEPVTSVPEVPAQEIDDAFVLDVRQDAEYEAGHIPGAVHVELGSLADEESRVPRDRRVVVACGHGQRSMSAIALLERAGFSQLANLAGGTTAWVEAGLPVETAAPR